MDYYDFVLFPIEKDPEEVLNETLEVLHSGVLEGSMNYFKIADELVDYYGEHLLARVPAASYPSDTLEADTHYFCAGVNIFVKESVPLLNDTLEKWRQSIEKEEEPIRFDKWGEINDKQEILFNLQKGLECIEKLKTGKYLLFFIGL
ncbi:hypothetical protein MKZ08_14730 [Viridibacillus sp. FSL R5-0477]|uniref:Uncharacterized protein n=1 Tax=Viridibacillus arenosi FSL R5-213 TaxID=1227360 RepID=W4EK48_9BACL|nr:MULTISPECIES: hypothetical protein [Viridibacillus]ETT80930.1 hypothetical protein C176_19484 [Viridibacillus arenosi FSL R5-213]